MISLERIDFIDTDRGYYITTGVPGLVTKEELTNYINNKIKAYTLEVERLKKMVKGLEDDDR